MSEETTDGTEYISDDYISVHINIKEREERRRIRELNKRLQKNK